MGDTQGFNPDVPNAGQFVTLPSLFAFRGETINYQTDAKTEPATFSPLCSFSGTLVLRGGGCKLAFGWYNAVMSGGPAPAANEIYPLIPNNDPVVYGRAAFAPLATTPPMVGGMPAWALKVFTAADIRNDVRYKGGEIGFALIGDSGTACKQTKFSQRALNQVCTACTPNQPWIQTVVYKSTKEDNAYYLGFEDLPSDPASFKAQNDGDFNDFVFYITGLVCAGGGEPCDTGLKGACAIGKTDCSEAGKPGQCRQVVHETKEECDNVDNNCDGMVDNGDLCPAGKVCENGNCVAACGTGEFRCPLELECEKGFCIDPRCKNLPKPCEEGQACRAGKCVGLCDDVTCPSGQECQLGRCVDLCAGVKCLEKQVCEGGLCLSDCGCRSCGAGKACGKEGKCVDTGCETQTCEAGKLCVKGTCKDPCDGAACPGHGACVDGQCQAPAPTIGGSGGGTSEGGTDSLGGFGPLAGTSFIENGGGTGGATSAAGTGPNNVRPILKSGDTATGCNCRSAGGTPGSSGSSVAWLAAALAALTVVRRRRAA
jgi:MYXO-CTERM domain-containing protein